MNRHECIIYVAHHQFYLRDSKAEWRGEYTNDPWGDDNLGTAPGIVGVQNPRAAGSVAVFIEVHDRPPPEADERFAKVAVASIDVPSGALTVEGEANDVSDPPFSLSIAPGPWNVTVLFADLDTTTYDDEDGADHYILQLWRGPAREASVVRAPEPHDDPVRTYSGTATTEQLAFTARGADASAACSALVSLARKGERALVLEIGLAAKSDAVRLVAANALWLAGDAEGLARFTRDRRKPIAALAELAIERLSE